MERRESNRKEINVKIDLSLDERTIHCTMVNLSKVGALFKIYAAEQDSVYTEDLGEMAHFVVKVSSEPDRKYTGEIIRMFRRDDDKYIALRFWEKYKELN